MDQHQFTRVVRRNLLIFAEILLADFLENLDKPDEPVKIKILGAG